MAGSRQVPTQATERETRGYRTLVVLYCAALVLANPAVAFGLFYIVLAVWLVLAVVAMRPGAFRHRFAGEGLLLAVVVWILAVVPSMMFLTWVGAVLWYAGEFASIALATYATAWAAEPFVGRDRDRGRLRRLGFASGIATALLLLFPVGMYLVPGFEAATLVNPILFYLPQMVMLATAVVAGIAFAEIPRIGGPS